MHRGRKHLRNVRGQFFEGMGVPEAAPFVPDSFQLEAIASAVEGHDTLVIAPTGSGKTYIATQAIERTARDGKRSIYTTPLKALSNSKYSEFKTRFEPDYRVGILTGDRKIETDAQVVVATTEIYRNELYRGYETFSLVVLDELHYLADAQRGPVWEESIILSPQSASLLMLSASVSNATEIAEWIHSVRKKKVNIVTKKDRPVELRLGFIHPDFGVLPLEEDNGEVLREVTEFYSQSRANRFRRGKVSI
jgi:superfamily II RNA helicase